MKPVVVWAVLAAAAACAAGCGTPKEEANPVPPARQPAPPAALELGPPTSDQAEAARAAGKVRVRLTTNKGAIELELDGAAAPYAVANFLSLVKAGFYNGMPFHRVEPGFVIQAGDPAGVGRPPVNYTIPDERSPIKHVRGTIAMARLYRGGQMVPNSASTQFYICLGDAPHLDAAGFTAFGRVVGGMHVIDKIAVGDGIVTADVEQGRGGPPT